MSFVFCFFIAAILYFNAESQSTHPKEFTGGINLMNISDFQVEDENTSFPVAAIVTFSDQSSEVRKNEYNSSSFGWSAPNFIKEESTTEGKLEDPFSPSPIPLGTVNATLDNPETSPISIEYELINDTESTVVLDASASLSTPLELEMDVNGTFDHGETIISDIPNVTISSGISNTSRESRDYMTFPNKEQQENLLMALKSNCTIINSENITLNEEFAGVDCTIYVRVNFFSSENGTHDRLLNILKKLSFKPTEFQMVEMYGESGQSKEDKSYRLVLDQETFAYIAVAFAFAFLLLLAAVVFGIRCFRKRKPSLDMSHFDVKLSSYTLTKIPRASLSSLDCLQDSVCLDDKPESSAEESRNYEICESTGSLGILPHDVYSSNREMKTFGVPRIVNNRSPNSTSDIFPQHNPIAYENHTFQGYY